MPLQEFVGSVSLEFDSNEIEVVQFSIRVSTGRKPLISLGAGGWKGRGFTEGVKVYSLSMTVVIPVDGGAIEWEDIRKGKLTVEPVNGGQRYSYLDCCVIETGDSYHLDGEAVKDISMQSFKKVTE